MASLVVSGDTSGAITLSAPAVAGTNTLSLPAQTATLATLTTPSFATTIGVGGATAAASGAGITFPASQSASSDANTLDDYEEGTFTATLTSSTPPSSPPTATGNYTKIGNIVNIAVRFSNVTTTGGSGTLFINGLPFTCAASPQDAYGGSVALYGMNFSGSYVYLYVQSGDSFMQGLAINSGGNWAGFNMTAGTAKFLMVSVTYRVA